MTTIQFTDHAPPAIIEPSPLLRQPMKPVLPPFGWSKFRVGAPNKADLDLVNTEVNERITYTPPCLDPAAAERIKEPDGSCVGIGWRVIWSDSPNKHGDCHDYAVTKRAELLARGWPASRLLLAEVKFDQTEDHLILIVTNGDDLVLDNRRDDIVPWAKSGYTLVRMQSPDDPDRWRKF